MGKFTKEQITQIVDGIMNAEANDSKSVKKTAMPAAERENLVETLLRDPSGRGLKRIAYAMTEPLRTKLDYIGIGRKFLQTDLLPQGAPAQYDKDFDEQEGTKVAARGVPPVVESWSDRIEVNTFDISTIRSLKYSEISIRRFDSLNRTKDRAAFELKLAEDEEIFSVIETAATAGGQSVSVVGDITRNAFAEAFADVENNRLFVENILMHPTSFKGIRKFNRDDLDQVNFQALLETGLMGSIFGANIYVSTKCPTNTIYVMCMKEQFGRIPIRFDVEIKPFDFPIELSIFFTVYENLGLVVHNNLGVSKITRTS